MPPKRNRSPSPSHTKKNNTPKKGIVRSIINWWWKKPPTPKRKSPKVSLKSIVALKRVINRRATRKAAKNRTYAFNQIEKVALQIEAPRNNLPPPVGFIGTTKQKYERALTYRNRLTKHAKTHAKIYDQPLYRGVYGAEFYNFLISTRPVHKLNMSSFSKSYEVARRFAERKAPKTKRAVLILDTMGKKIPSVDYTTGQFKSKYNSEKEVLLPPGKFYKLGHDINRRHDMDLIHVGYQAD